MIAAVKHVLDSMLTLLSRWDPGGLSRADDDVLRPDGEHNSERSFSCEKLAFDLALGRPVVEEALARKVRAAQLRTIVQLTPYLMAVNVFDGIVVLSVLWHALPATLLLGWFALLLAMMVVGGKRWRETQKNQIDISDQSSLSAITRNATYLAIVWGLVPVLSFPVIGPQSMLVVACLTTGMTSAGAFVLSTIPAAALIWLGVIGISTLGCLAFVPYGIALPLAMLLVSFNVIVISSVLSMGRLFVSRFLNEAELDRRREVIQLLLNDFEESASDWLWETDAKGRFVRVSERLAQVCNKSREELHETDLCDLVSEESDGRNDNPRMHLRSVMQQGKPLRQLVVPIDVEDERRWWSLTARPFFDANGRFQGFRGVGADITEVHRSDAYISHLSQFDGLTGAGNRNWFMSLATEAIERGKIRGTILHLLLIDLDDFKSINETRGHEVGDILLCSVVKRLKQVCDGEVILARLGSDEFAVLYVGGSGEDAIQFAERLLTILSAAFDVGHGNEVQLSASIGIARFPDLAATLGELMRAADIALYRAKRQGRSNIVMFAKDMARQEQERRELELALRNAVFAEHLNLVYQPIVRADTGEVVGCEALMRWQHPILGGIPPSIFIPMAEDAGLIRQMGAWALKEACRAAARADWPLIMSVNLSPLQFASKELVTNVKEALDAVELDPSRLILEVTESVLMQNNSSTKEILDAFAAMGVHVALDDFGTGYSSLSYLRQYSFSKLKIDQSFVAEIGRRADSLAIISAIISLAGNLSIEVTAEGVETETQEEILRALGCDYLQGYHFGKPISSLPSRDIAPENCETGTGRIGNLDDRSMLLDLTSIIPLHLPRRDSLPDAP